MANLLRHILTDSANALEINFHGWQKVILYLAYLQSPVINQFESGHITLYQRFDRGPQDLGRYWFIKGTGDSIRYDVRNFVEFHHHDDSVQLVQRYLYYFSLRIETHALRTRNVTPPSFPYRLGDSIVRSGTGRSTSDRGGSSFSRSGGADVRGFVRATGQWPVTSG